MDRSVLSVGLLGLGVVGSEVYRLLQQEEEISRRAGIPVRVARIVVSDPTRVRSVAPPAAMLATDPAEVVESSDIDIVVELMGGLEPARTLVLRALGRRKPVVTANKQLMAAHAADLFAAAEGSGVDLAFEGSVGGGIPLIKPIRESLAAAHVTSIIGILNGTTNYILTKMAHEGWSVEQALVQAQARGFAEADPTDDLEGHDAAAKLAILASVAFHVRLTVADIYREGIARISPQDFAYAKELGFAIRLLAIARHDGEAVEARVHPALLPFEHPLAGVVDEYNAVLVQGEGLGEVMFSGRGAGGAPTAAAVVGDIIDVARNLRLGAGGRVGGTTVAEILVRPIEDVRVPYYLNLQVTDRPGVFARVATVFGEEAVSIASIVQKSRGEVADVVLVTHDAPERAMRRVLDRLGGMDVVRSVRNVIRVEGTV